MKPVGVTHNEKEWDRKNNRAWLLHRIFYHSVSKNLENRVSKIIPVSEVGKQRHEQVTRQSMPKQWQSWHQNPSDRPALHTASSSHTRVPFTEITSCLWIAQPHTCKCGGKTPPRIGLFISLAACTIMPNWHCCVGSTMKMPAKCGF